MRVFAPAKINLYLHIQKKLDNGYHHLDSLVAFCDIGDVLHIEEANGFSFNIDGPFSSAFSDRDFDSSAQSSNLVVMAAWRLAQQVARAPNVDIRLTKNLPLGGGIGGGSSDAAAAVWGLCSLWDIPHEASFMDEFLLSLGADVPVCYRLTTKRMQGIGDVLKDAPALPELPIILVNPGQPCSTPDIFRHYQHGFQELVAMPPTFQTRNDLIAFLRRCDNVLTAAAIQHVPNIQNVLMDLEGQEGCELARMSGSGSTCFGIFNDAGSAKVAADGIRDKNPDWWVTHGVLGQVERY